MIRLSSSSPFLAGRRIPPLVACLLLAACGSDVSVLHPNDGGSGGEGGAPTSVTTSQGAVTGSGTGTSSTGAGAGPLCDPPGAPEALASQEAPAAGGAIVATQKEVYWIELGPSPIYEANGAIYRTHKCGGEPKLLVDDELRFPTGLGRYSNTVPWTELGYYDNGGVSGGIIRTSVKTLAYDDCAPTSVATDGTQVFWSSSCGIYRMPLAGGATTTLSFQGSPAIAVDDEHLFWIATGGGIAAVSKSGGPTITITESPPTLPTPCGGASVPSLADGGDALFWTICGQVLRVDKAGGSPQVLANSAGDWPVHGSAGLIAADDEWVYWSLTTGLMAIDRNGEGPPFQVHPGTLGYAGGVYVDELAVYWVDGSTVWRLPKPSP